MRTTLNIEDDVLLAVKDRARRQKVSVGELVSQLLRQALQSGPAHGSAESESFYGFEPLPARDTVVSNELIERLRDDEGI